MLASSSTAGDISSLINHLRGPDTTPLDFVIRLGTKRLTSTLSLLVEECTLGGEDLIALNYELPQELPEEVASIEEQEWIRIVAISPDAQWVASGSYDRRVRLYCLTQSSQVHSLCAFVDSPTCMCWLDSQVLVVATADGGLWSWRVHKNTTSVKVSHHPSAIQRLLLNAEALLVGDYEGNIYSYSVPEIHSLLLQDALEPT